MLNAFTALTIGFMQYHVIAFGLSAPQFYWLAALNIGVMLGGLVAVLLSDGSPKAVAERDVERRINEATSATKKKVKATVIEDLRVGASLSQSSSSIL